jgi:hypothetical protein
MSTFLFKRTILIRIFLLVTGSADDQGVSQTATFTLVASDKFSKRRALDAFFTAGTQLTDNWKASLVADDISIFTATRLETLHILRASGAHTQFIYTVTDVWCFPHFVTPLLCLAVRHRH